jgi:hypothetical protein
MLFVEKVMVISLFYPYFRLIYGVDIEMVCELRIRYDLKGIGHGKSYVIFCICLTRLRKITKNFSQESH